MRFASIRELRNQPGKLWKGLSDSEEINAVIRKARVRHAPGS